MYDSTIGKKYLLKYKNLLPGDIILESGKKVHSKAIQLHTKSRYSHVMVCLLTTSLFDAEKKGIFTLNPQRVLVEEQNDLKIMRPKKLLTKDETEKIIQFFKSKVGTLYSVSEAVISGKKERPKNTKTMMQFCSRLVAQAYAHIGYKIVKNPDFCQPAEIERSEFFEEVPNMVKRANKEELNYTSTKNLVLENQVSTYKWLNKTEDYALAEFNYNKIYSQQDTVFLLLNIHKQMIIFVNTLKRVDI